MNCLDTYINVAKGYLGATKGTSQHKAIINQYNSLKTMPRGYRAKVSDPWCAIFVTAVARQTGIEDSFPCECSCYYMKRIAQQRGWVIDKHNIRRGDLVIYNWDRDSVPDHVGICIQAANGMLKVLEGNKDDRVAYRDVNCGNICIDCGIRIPWETFEPAEKESEMIKVAKRVIRGDYGNGAVRKKKLEESGYEYYEIQSLVNKLLKA